MPVLVLLATIIKIVAAVRKYAALLSALSNRGLVEGLISSFVVGQVKDALVASGVPVDRFDFHSQASQWIDKVVSETAGDLGELGLLLEPELLIRQLVLEEQRFQNGHDVANGTSAVRWQSRGADPIIFHRGEFEHASVDLFIRGAGLDLTFRRVYRSGADTLGPFGRGWDHGLNLRLFENVNPLILSRATGDLAHDKFVRHPRFGDDGFGYFAPPDGVHDVIILDESGSFLLQRPLGSTIEFEATTPGSHRARSIRDGLGNELRLSYNPDDLLARVLVNGAARQVEFSYDSSGRLAGLRDHAGRIVTYCYDETGLLTAASEITASGATGERYEYEAIGAHWRLARVLDERGVLIVENEYDRRVSSDHFGFVVRQETHTGTQFFEYESLATQEQLLQARDLPTVRVFEMLPDGHVVEHTLNEFGNELLRREDFSDGGMRRTALKRTRFNADGLPIAVMDAEGGLVQHLYQRDHLNARTPWPDAGTAIADLAAVQRQAFGTLLATVERGRAMPVEFRNAEQPDWLASLPPVEIRTDPADAITKLTYDAVTQVLTSRSDRRHTASADPLHVESAPSGTPLHDPAHPDAVEHQRHLTLFDYENRRRLIRTRYPDRTGPAGALAGIFEEVVRMDSHGRALEKRDRRGYPLYMAYFDASDGAKEGFLRSELRAHLDWRFDLDTPDILEIRPQGDWQRGREFWRSGGSIRDQIEIDLVGNRIELSANHPAAASIVNVRVDGAMVGPWDQASAPFVIEGLPAGVHTVGLASDAEPIVLARVLTHVRTDYDVDDLGRLIRETGPRGIERLIAYDHLDREIRVERGLFPALSTVESSFDSRGLLVAESTAWRAPDGTLMPERAVVRRYCYQASGWLAEEEQASLTGSERRRTQYRYDSRGHVVASVDARGIQTSFTYNSLGHCTMVVEAACTSVEARTTRGFDQVGRTLWERKPNGALVVHGRLGPSGVMSGYDARGRQILSTDPLGHLTTVVRDADGRELVTRRFGRSGPGYAMISRREQHYDEHGTLVRSVDAIFDSPIHTTSPLDNPDVEYQASMAAGAVREAATEYQVDAFGNVTVTVDPVGGTMRRRFDPQNRVVGEVDAAGRETFRILDADGNTIRQYEFEVEGPPAEGGLARVFFEESDYDALQRRTVRRDANHNSWQDSFDSLGNCVQRVDPVGARVQHEFNAFGEETLRVEEHPGRPATTLRYYDATGNLLAIEDANGRRHEFVFDPLGRLVFSRNASDVADPGERFKYDRADNLIERTDRNGMIETIERDAEGRVLRRSFNWSAVPPDFAPSHLSPTFAAFEYDALGSLVRHSNDWCSGEIGRDSRGLLRSEQFTLLAANGVPTTTTAVLQECDDVGRVVRIIYPSGRRVRFDRNTAGLVTAVINEALPRTYPGRVDAAAQEVIVQYEYGIGRRLQRVIYPHAAMMGLFLYDARGHVVEHRVDDTADSTILWRTQTIRDEAGRIRKETAAAPAFSDAAVSRVFEVDLRGRLTGYGSVPVSWLNAADVAPPSRSSSLQFGAVRQAISSTAITDGAVVPSASFTYDEVGNRLSTQEPGGVSFTSVPDNADRYGTVGGSSWAWDPEGRLLSDGFRQFTYASDGLLTQESPTGAPARTYGLVRDALGRVAAVILPTGFARMVYLDRSALVWSSEGSDAEFTPGRSTNEVVHIAARSRDTWVVMDGRRSPRFFRSAAAAAGGFTDGATDFLPYGRDNVTAGVVPGSWFPFSFAGMLRLPGSSLLHTATRSYLPEVGRFMQTDPAGFIEGTNRYIYARNNPLDFVDPSGLQTFSASDELSKSDKRIINALEENWSEIIEAAEHKALSPQEAGKHMHQQQAGEGRSASTPSFRKNLADFDAQRIATEVAIDEQGIIRKVHGNPLEGGNGWIWVDNLIIREDIPGGADVIEGMRASDVAAFAIDNKSSNADLKKRIELESRIGNRPVVKLTGRKGELQRLLIKRVGELGEPKLQKKLAEKSEKRAAKFGVKSGARFLAKKAPILGGFYTYMTAEGSQFERFTRGVGSQVPIPVAPWFSLEDLYDFLQLAPDIPPHVKWDPQPFIEGHRKLYGR